MFMKCFKKKLATGFVVASMVCGFGSSAFASSISNREILREGGTTTILKYTMDNEDYCYVYYTVSNADSIRNASDTGIAASMQCFQKQNNNEQIIKNLEERLAKLEQKKK